MDRDMIIILSAVIALTLTGVTMYKYITYIELVQDEACHEIGFENFEYKSHQAYCEDIYGNLHYVKEDCKLAGLHCTVHEITVGDMRTKYDAVQKGDEQ